MNQTIKILLVEDNPGDVRLVQEMLKESGGQFEMATARTLSAALKRLETERFDAVLADLGLPDAKGLEVMRKIQAQAPHIALVVLTGAYEDEALALEAVQEGAQDYLIKARLVSHWLARAIRYAVERKRTAEALKRKDEQLMQAQKMELAGRLAGGVAHHFSNLLTEILGLAHIIREDYLKGDLQSSDIDDLLSSAKRASELSAQLLLISQGKPINKQALQLNEKLEAMKKTLQTNLGEGVRLKLDCPEELLWIAADPVLLEQVLLNLCSNSRDAMGGRGMVVINIRRIHLKEFLSAWPQPIPPGRYISLEVSDTGRGIDSETASRLFEPFFTTRPAKARGLGLSTVYGIVRQHEGFIAFTSQEGLGTTFTVYFPDLGILPPLPQRNGKHDLPKGDETLLLAENEPMAGMIVRRVLQNQGYKVLMASDGEEAVRLFLANKDKISMVILDVVMPGLDGIEVYQKASSEKPGLKALFVSAYATLPGAGEISRLNLPFIEKPYAPDIVIRRVRELLDS